MHQLTSEHRHGAPSPTHEAEAQYQRNKPHNRIRAAEKEIDKPSTYKLSRTPSGSTPLTLFTATAKSCSGSDAASYLEEDVASFEDDDIHVDHWPERSFQSQNLPTPSFAPQHGRQVFSPRPRPVSGLQRTVPAQLPRTVGHLSLKTARGAPSVGGVPGSRSALPLPGVSPRAPSRPSPNFPAFAPRDAYVKLSFNGNPSMDTKLRWLSAINKAFQLQRDLAVVKTADVNWFVYISCQRTEILEHVKCDDFLSLTPHDSSERSHKFPSYILTRFPVDVDHRLAETHHGVHSPRRFIRDESSPMNHIVVVWSLPDRAPHTITFDFFPCLPACEVRKLHNDQPWCYRCWGVDRISRYCSALPKCAWSAACHDSRTCPVKSEPSRPAASSTTPGPLSLADVSRWMCPRCLLGG
ncbi:uncharacterized protein LOC135094172 [Scylla paramamosain]|uniref:uncharacterized protein LOC135094172 n=1 Tax=Scylla paramamosain TaxID=85552 RepID=UPI0030839DD6